MKSDFIKLILREFNIGLRNLFIIFTFFTFFITAILIFVFAFGSNISQINGIYKPIILVILIFSIMLISENFIINDYLDGSLKELQFLGYSEELIFVCKSITMWIMVLMPTIFLFPIFSIFSEISLIESFYFFLNILFATPSLILISLISSLFSAQLKRSKIIQFIIIFPFYIPIIIFTTAANNNIEKDNFYNSNFLILIGIFFITLPVCLYASKLIMKEINR